MSFTSSRKISIACIACKCKQTAQNSHHRTGNIRSHYKWAVSRFLKMIEIQRITKPSSQENTKEVTLTCCPKIFPAFKLIITSMCWCSSLLKNCQKIQRVKLNDFYSVGFMFKPEKPTTVCSAQITTLVLCLSFLHGQATYFS